MFVAGGKFVCEADLYYFYENLSLEDLENLSEDIFDLNALEDLTNWLANREVL